MDENITHYLSICEVNEKTKVMNKNVPVGKLFPLLPRDRERFLSGRTGNDIDK